MVWGTTGDWGRALAGVSRSSRGMVYAQDRPWSAGPMFSAYANNYGRVGFDAEGNPIPLFALIGSAKDFHPEEIGCGDIGGGFLDGDDLCFYDYTLVSADEAATANESIFATGEFDINHDWRISSRASYTRADSFGRFAPAPETILLDANSASIAQATSVSSTSIPACGPIAMITTRTVTTSCRFRSRQSTSISATRRTSDLPLRGGPFIRAATPLVKA